MWNRHRLPAWISVVVRLAAAGLTTSEASAATNQFRGVNWTGNAQNVSDVGSDSRLNGCLLGVYDYRFFGSDTWTSESQWQDHIKGEVGNYADRTVCTEWVAP